jgi:hypothetical protein
MASEERNQWTNVAPLTLVRLERQDWLGRRRVRNVKDVNFAKLETVKVSDQ